MEDGKNCMTSQPRQRDGFPTSREEVAVQSGRPFHLPKASKRWWVEASRWKIATNLEHNYTMFQSDGGFHGGFVGPAEPSYKPDRLLVYLAADDIDATLAAVEAHGGKTVIPKTEIPHVGWWAVFTDPAGNHLGLFIRHAAGS